MRDVDREDARHEIEKAMKRISEATGDVWGPSTRVYLDDAQREGSDRGLFALKALLQNLADAVEEAAKPKRQP